MATADRLAGAEIAPAQTVIPDYSFAGTPDAFQRLWTPYRMAYIGNEAKDQGCPFCAGPTYRDDETLIVRRGTHAFVLMNLYPYSTGHLLVCPYRHVASYIDLTDAERDEIAVLTQEAIRVVTAVSQPAGFNLGMNQGAVAGAGIAGHVHQHVVPRWPGDMNFFPIIAQTRAIPQLLSEGRQLIASAWEDNCAG
ncbi:MAG: HIT family protein [Propionibacteriaceae bacterium]